MGGYVQNIVVDKDSMAKDLVNFLKDGALGRATFLPLESIKVYKEDIPSQVKKETGYIGNAIELVKILMKYHGFNIGQVKQHYNWTKKDCPTWLRSGKFGLNWKWFTEQCGGKTISKNISVAPPSTFKPYIAKATTNDLNCRKGPGMNYDVETQIDRGTAITIIEQRMNGTTKWLKAKSGYWVAAKYMEFVKYV